MVTIITDSDYVYCMCQWAQSWWQFCFHCRQIQLLSNVQYVSISQVYLDISFRRDPKVVFPLVIAPSSIANVVLREAVETNPASTSGGPS